MTCVLVWSGLYSVAIQFVKLLLACCRQHGSNILRAGDIRLVGATCNKPDQVAKLVIQDAKNLFQTCQTAWKLEQAVSVSLETLSCARKMFRAHFKSYASEMCGMRAKKRMCSVHPICYLRGRQRAWSAHISGTKKLFRERFMKFQVHYEQTCCYLLAGLSHVYFKYIARYLQTKSWRKASSYI